MPKCSGQRIQQNDFLEKVRHPVAFLLQMNYWDPFTLTDWSTSATCYDRRSTVRLKWFMNNGAALEPEIVRNKIFFCT